ncbi:MAG TPA: rhomboid family intramembrane serine protease, partial [Propionibacteriaceae bacterium]|nr:rhomboid family intramembrane serine protease [Propionibacteriaceae bacterium]
WLSGSDQERPWFHIRSYGVGTADFVAGISVLMMIVSAISSAAAFYLALTPDLVLRGFVWQVVTWPLASDISFWTLWNAVVFWFTGRQLERELGKGRFGWMLLGITVTGAVLAVLLALAFRVNAPQLGGLSTIAMITVLLFIAENPRMPFFFGIPAWVLGLVIVILPLLQYVGARYWIGLLHFVLSLLVAAVVAKFAGLLSRYRFIPGRTYTPGQRRRRRAAPPPRATGGPSNVVQGPWLVPEPPAREDEEMDALLDKIMAQGLDSLTPRERRRLEELRQQRRAR